MCTLYKQRSNDSGFCDLCTLTGHISSHIYTRGDLQSILVSIPIIRRYDSVVTNYTWILLYTVTGLNTLLTPSVTCQSRFVKDTIHQRTAEKGWNMDGTKNSEEQLSTEGAPDLNYKLIVDCHANSAVREPHYGPNSQQLPGAHRKNVCFTINL